METRSSGVLPNSMVVATYVSHAILTVWLNARCLASLKKEKKKKYNSVYKKEREDIIDYLNYNWRID